MQSEQFNEKIRHLWAIKKKSTFKACQKTKLLKAFYQKKIVVKKC